MVSNTLIGMAMVFGILFVIAIVSYRRKGSDSDESSTVGHSRQTTMELRADRATGNKIRSTLTGKDLKVLHDRIKLNCGTASHIGVKAFSKEAGWKKKLDEPHVAYKATTKGILELIIPEGATVVCPRGNAGSMIKMRTDKVYVNAILDRFKQPLRADKTMSLHQQGFYYYVGERHTPDRLDERLSARCSNGIHFFPDFRGAMRWFDQHAPKKHVHRPGNLDDRIDKRRKEWKRRHQAHKRMKPKGDVNFGTKDFPKKKSN